VELYLYIFSMLLCCVERHVYFYLTPALRERTELNHLKTLKTYCTSPSSPGVELKKKVNQTKENPDIK
jgi:hypothetical protein